MKFTLSFFQLGVMEEMLQMPQDALKSFKEAHTRLADLEATAKVTFLAMLRKDRLFRKS